MSDTGENLKGESGSEELDLEVAKAPHKCVVLFYKYFLEEATILSSSSPSSSSSTSFVEELKTFLHHVCTNLQMKGRILLANEGINGTLSASNRTKLDIFTQKMEAFKYEYTYKHSCASKSDEKGTISNLFHSIDWKFSGVDGNQNGDLPNCYREPFPDLKISIVKEIVSSGGAIQVHEIPKYGGKHLTPKEFHQALKEGWGDGDGENVQRESKKEVVVIDVRNTFEHNIGHFRKRKRTRDDIHGQNSASSLSIIKAINPQMVTFSSFDTNFCAENANYLKDKKVLMYCTGGIRCEKASAMLRKRGVEDVSQLSGGIHRYLEEFPQMETDDGGYFEGKNFVFDQRVALGGGNSSIAKTAKSLSQEGVNATQIVGSCVECTEPYDEISGSRVCSVCRDLVLICPKCVSKLREFHCERHQPWKEHYFTFLESFTMDDLKAQKEGLEQIRNLLLDENGKVKGRQKNTRRTLMKQITKIGERIKELKSGEAHVIQNAPKRCRTCRESNDVCDGLCWGFWKQSTGHGSKNANTSTDMEHSSYDRNDIEEILPISVGDRVRPGSDWNEVRFGKKSAFGIGTVVEIKSWKSGGETNDCVSVSWLWEDTDTTSGTHERGDDKGDKRSLKHKNMESNIYRWGALDNSGVRVYDLELIPP